MRDGEEVLKRVRREVAALRERYELGQGSYGERTRYLAWMGRDEYLKYLTLLAYAPEPHPPPPVIECDDCEGKGFVWGNVQGPVKIDCADCNGLGYLYDPCFHCGHHDPERDPAVSCYYCENWPLPTPRLDEGPFLVASQDPQTHSAQWLGSAPNVQSLPRDPVGKTLKRFQYLGSLAESDEDVKF